MHQIDAPSAHLPVRDPRRLLAADIRLGVVLVGAALLGAAACGSADSGGRDAVPETPVYVLNLHGAEQGRPDRRPRDLVVSEFTALSEVSWHSWGPTRAAGEGRLTGSWCLPGCADTPYDATVTLSGVVPVRGKGYFTRYEITADVPPDLRERADLKGVMPTPESAVG